MIIRSFIFCGFVCLIAQIIKDKTKLTSGHITSLFTIMGAIFGFFGIYDKAIDYFGGGAIVTIISFGNNLYNTALKYGILNMLMETSLGITLSIIMSFIITLIFRVKD